MQDGKKRWLIRDSDGRVRGPYFTDEILSRIARGEFVGDEKISLYPGTDWIPISRKPEFYDRLLETLEEEDAKLGSGSRSGSKEPSAEPFTPSASKPVTKTPSKLDLNSQPSLGSSQNTGPQSGKTNPGNEPKEESKEIPKEEPVRNRAERVGKARLDGKSDDERKNKNKKSEDEKANLIELQPKKKALRKAKAKKSIFPALLAMTVVAAAGLYIIFEPSDVSEKVRLIHPRKGQPALSPEAVKSKIQSAIAYYSSDNFSGYIRAQSDLVQAIEGDIKNAGAMALLCLDYLELWPFAKQDSADLYAVSAVTQLAGQVDPAGVDAATCRTVDLLIRGRFIEARGVTESVLETFSAGNQPPVAFYYFKALLLAQNKEYSGALGYAQYAQPLWPSWIRVYSLEAEMYSKLGQHQNAANRYRQILKSNPNHKVSLYELGTIEIRHLKNYQEGERLIGLALNSSEKVSARAESRAFMTMSLRSAAGNDQANALAWAEKAYRVDPFNEEAKNMIVSLAGESKLTGIRIHDTQYMFEGDQLVREGNCVAAQALYKSAYEVNPKNGMAAIKAAECLWQSSLSTEAIEWLNKAIKADPKLIDAYIILADYFTQRFKYTPAAQVLQKARSEFPQSYKVFRGMALFELRRNNLQGAISYADRAIQLYEADVESYVIKAEALIKQGQFANALTAATKAVEIDINNRDAQVTYAKSMARARGMHIGIDYLMRLVNLYPTITAYRFALGELYFEDQGYGNAREVFEQIARIEEKPKKALIELGKIAQMERQFDEALKLYFRAAEMDPADVEPLYRAGVLYMDAGKPAEAKQQFLRVQRINPDYPLLNYYMGRAALMMESPDEALQLANLEKQKNPKLADPYLLAAEAHMALGQYSQCAGEYQKAAQLRKSQATIYIKMAQCYRQSGNLDAAVAMINQAREQESGNPDVWKEQGAVYETRGDKISAIEAYNQYLVLAPNAVDRGQIEARIQALSQ